MDVACPGNPPFGLSRPPLVAGAGGGEVVGASKVTMRERATQNTPGEHGGEVRPCHASHVARSRRFCRPRVAARWRAEAERGGSGPVNDARARLYARARPGPWLFLLSGAASH